ncbi:MAG TPA: carboxypeptidase regulatory-like domain-containing protein [Mucilaginibacter sp.]|nr:carboxypeptidase regulatory-like domain-containing protein [Mucilaginibacter sp.]
MPKAFILFLFLLPFSAFAQFTISGRVLNRADKKPVANASIFLGNASVGGKTADDGTFILRDAKPGKYDLVVSVVGFDVYSQPFVINNSNITLPDIEINPREVALKEVTIKAKTDPERERHLLWFKQEFLGRSPLAEDCKILNPGVIDLDYDNDTNTLTGSSYDFIQIENDALGYKISYLLTNFTLINKYQFESSIHYEGSALFTPLKGTPAQERRWQKKRQEVYEGSAMHFFRAAYNNQIDEDGFRVLRIVARQDPKKTKSNIISMVMPSPLTSAELLKPTDQAGIYALKHDSDVLHITYNKYHHFRSAPQLTNLNDPYNIETTIISFNKPYIMFDKNGGVVDPNSASFTGAWARNRIAGLLPLDYESKNEENRVDNAPLSKAIKVLQQYTAAHPVEKVHLHLDRPWYGLGDTIWFKAYVVTGEHHQLSALSGVLYAELINPQDSVVKRLTLQLDSGISNGDFTLPYSYKAGNYRIRAYTNWMRNDSDAWFYNQTIRVGGIDLSEEKKPVKPLISTVNNVPTKQQNIDVQFLPEGGELVNGLRSKVAVKAISNNGASTDIKGSITEDGTEVATFSTQHAGMGAFALTPQPGKVYKAIITRSDGSTYPLDLPKAKEEGFTLTLNNSSVDNIYLKIAANDQLYQKIRNNAFYLMGRSGGKVYYTASAKLENQVFTTTIEKSRFPSGIVQFTLFSQSGEPLNERVVFIQNADELKLKLNTDKELYIPGEKVKIDLGASSGDKAVSGSFSVSVTDETKVPVDVEAETTILTNLLLTSELKGAIERPNYYFTNRSDKTDADLDLLMLTQGYRSFGWKKILAGSEAKPAYQPETALSLSGTIKTPGNQPVPGGSVRLTSIKDHLSLDTLTDASGNFTFRHINLQDTAKVIINASKTSGGKNVKISIKEPSFQSVNKTDHTFEDVPDRVKDAMNQSYAAGQKNIKLDSMNRVRQLAEVKVKSKRETPFKPKYNSNMLYSSNLNGPGNANEVILGDKLIGCSTLSECLSTKIFGVSWRGGIPYSVRAVARSISGSAHPMAVLIEGMQRGAADLDLINPNDVYSVEVLTSQSYLSLYGSNAAYGALVITLKRGAELGNPASIAVDGLITYKFKGYYKAREFYSPKYTSKNEAQLIGERKTIYWNPNIITDEKGKATFEYYNGGKGNYRVVIEGIDGDGNLGRAVYRYKVE